MLRRVTLQGQNAKRRFSATATRRNRNGHLPDIPSQAEVQEEGYSQHDINTRFLEKIEQLTLYKIEQRERSQALRARLQEQQQKVAALQAALERE